MTTTTLLPLAPLTDDETRALGERGFFLRDAFLGPEAARAARAALADYEFHPAGIGRGGDLHHDSRVRSDEIAWLADDAPPALAAVRDRFDELRRAINESAWLGLRRCDVQLARYPGGGAAYARHRDAFQGSQSRVLTALCYLNPDWRPEHGGVLRLHLDPPIDVEPRLDRLVVFLSERIEHEVLPAFAPRYAAAAWYYSAP